MRNLTAKIAHRLTTERAREVRQIYARSRLEIGDRVASVDLDVVPLTDTGVVREIRGHLAMVEWVDGTCEFTPVGGLKRISQRFEHPLPDQSSLVPRPEALVRIGSVAIKCGVARTQEEQIAGLQPYSYLPQNHGLLFPYPEPKYASFHMGSVGFPIDIVFVQPDASGEFGRVAKVVDNVEPGMAGSWGERNVLAVVETPGGFCLRANINPGDIVRFADLRQASMTPAGPTEVSRIDDLYVNETDQPNTDMFRDEDLFAPASNVPKADDLGMPRGTDEVQDNIGAFSGIDPTGDPDAGTPTRMSG